MVIVFLDRSQSTGSFHELYGKTLDKVAGALTFGDRLIVGAITDKSAQDFSASVDHVLPEAPKPKKWWENDIGYEHAVLAKQASLKTSLDSLRMEIQTLRDQPSLAPQTTLFSSLRLAGQVFDSARARTPILVVVSDMLECSQLANFETGAVPKPEACIREHTKLGMLPHLKDVAVYVAGALSEPPPRAAAVESFWRAYLEASGAHLAQYAPTLVSFGS